MAFTNLRRQIVEPSRQAVNVSIIALFLALTALVIVAVAVSK